MKKEKPRLILKNRAAKINALPSIKLLDAMHGARQRWEVLSSFVQDYFSENNDTINVLEAGCGRKWHLDLGSIQYKLTGVDISKKALKLRISDKGDLDKAIIGDLRNVELDLDGLKKISKSPRA